VPEIYLLLIKLDRYLVFSNTRRFPWNSLKSLCWKIFWKVQLRTELSRNLISMNISSLNLKLRICSQTKSLLWRKDTWRFRKTKWKRVLKERQTECKGKELSAKIWEPLVHTIVLNQPHRLQHVALQPQQDRQRLPEPTVGNLRVKYFTKRQVERISDNISFKNGSPVESAKVHQIKVQVANRYISKYMLKAIPKNRRLGCVALFPKRHHSSRWTFRVRFSRWRSVRGLRRWRVRGFSQRRFRQVCILREAWRSLDDCNFNT
jgi:hypothetical protein